MIDDKTDLVIFQNPVASHDEGYERGLTAPTGSQAIGMTSEVTEPPRSGRPSAAGGIAWHTLSAGQVPHPQRVAGQHRLSSAGAATRAKRRPGLKSARRRMRKMALLGTLGIEHPAPRAGSRGQTGCLYDLGCAAAVHCTPGGAGRSGHRAETC